MAWASGTATDWMDFLRKIRGYSDGTIDPAVHASITNGVIVPVADRWTVLTNGASQPGIPASGFATDGEVYLQGPGSDPTDEVIVGLRTYRNVGANIFGIELRGYTAFDDGLTFTTMPGISPAAHSAFDDATFNCWFWVNRRRVMALARVGTTDILVHFGFIQQFGTRNQFPYPLLISGSASNTAISFQTNNFAHSCLPDPALNAAHLRWVDGTWQSFSNYGLPVNIGRSQARDSTGNVIWPQRNPTTDSGGSASSLTEGNEDAVFEAFTTGGAPYVTSSLIDAYTMFPATLFKDSAIVGRVDGLFATFGLGLVPGDTLTDSSSQIHDVFANTWRTEPLDFFAIRRE